MRCGDRVARRRCRVDNTSISHALIGRRVGIETGVTIGSQGFGFVPCATGLTRMLQLGRVVIEDDVQIGANCAIDRGATGDTFIGAGTVIDNLVQIAHNVRLGRNCVICAQVGIAGSAEVGDGVMMGGKVGVVDHLKVGAGARIAAMSGVLRNVEPAAVLGGIPAIPIKSGIARRSALPSFKSAEPDAKERRRTRHRRRNNTSRFDIAKHPPAIRAGSHSPTLRARLRRGAHYQ
jgi:UDP-3-O-[3-hydroxymyristoyl] glucosamine N-acyltransferase